MTPQQIALVRDSFAKVVPIKEQAAALFYDRLFALDPSTRALFRGDMKSQGAKLMAAIGPACLRPGNCLGYGFGICGSSHGGCGCRRFGRKR